MPNIANRAAIRPSHMRRSVVVASHREVLSNWVATKKPFRSNSVAACLSFLEDTCPSGTLRTTAMAQTKGALVDHLDGIRP